MIITKTPFRLPFAGGLTDLPGFAHEHGGVTVSATIDKYVYVGIKRNVDGYLNLKYMDVHEKVTSVDDVKHDLIREALRIAELTEEPLDIYIMVDLNSESGLGSSGAVTVGLLHGMHAYKAEEVSSLQLFEEAARIEVEILGGASGYHDPAICALGGLKLIEYELGGIENRPISIGSRFLEEFQNSLLFFYSGRHHKSKPSLDLLNTHIVEATPLLKEMKGNAYSFAAALSSGDLPSAAQGIARQQELKQRLPGMFVDEHVTEIVRRVEDLGAAAQLPGGKIGAFIMVCCPDSQQESVRAEFSEFREVKLRFSESGSVVHDI